MMVFFNQNIKHEDDGFSGGFSSTRFTGIGTIVLMSGLGIFTC